MIDHITNYPLLFGIIASVIHVLSGPDHLAAIGSFAINTKDKSWQIGFAWGFGHTLGLGLMGLLFYYFRELIPIEFISIQSEKIVGLILIVIGAWFIYKLTKKKKRTNEHSHIHIHTNSTGNTYAHFHPHRHKNDSSHDHTHSQKKEIYTTAGIGIIHGFAGISHLLSLLPTLAFSSHESAILYLIGFACGTIISMVSFSITLGIIGRVASQKSRKKPIFVINMIAAMAAIFIGIFWIFKTW